MEQIPYLTLGIDPALNNVGYCWYGDKDCAEPVTIKPPEPIPQFIKMVHQRDFLRKAIEANAHKVRYVGIEQPYVQGAGRFGGGHQSANMWAVYSMLLDVFRQFQLPTVMFNISQFHALIIRKKGLTKTEVVAKAKEEQPHFRRIDQHAADAYHIAKNAHAFWRLMDGFITPAELSKDQQDIFLSKRIGNAGDPAGIMWRGGDFWFDFRKQDPLTHPPGMMRICR